MKNIIFLALLPILMTSYYYRNENKVLQNQSSEIKKLIIGKWVLVKDEKLVMDIKEDSIVNYYEGKIYIKNPIIFSFGDSIAYYKNKDNSFDFMRSDGYIYPGVVIKEYDSSGKYTIINTIVYIGKDGIEMNSDGRDVNFRKQINE